MPRPWIPRVHLDPALHGKGQVQYISRKTGSSPPEVVKSLERFWLEAQARCAEGGVIVGKRLAWVDVIGNLPGLGVAMTEVDWLRADGADLVVPGFDAWLSKEAVKRFENAARMKARRAGQAGGITHDGVRSPTFVNVQDSNPPAGKAKKAKSVKVSDPNFWKFYRAYPKQWNQPAAALAWAELNPDEALVEVILAAVEAAKLSPHWTKRGPNGEDYIPAPANYLADRRWQDRVEPGAAGGTVHQGARIRSGSGGYGGKKFTPPADPLLPGGSPSLF